MGEENKDSKANLSYVEWLEQVVAEYQPDWICDELVTEDGWCYDRCESKWDKNCLKRYYNKHFDHDEFYDCNRYVVTNDEGERAYNCIGCEQTDCAWGRGENNA